MDIQDYQGFIFDLDGVVWRGKQVIPGAPEVITSLRTMGKQVAFVTNYAAESRRYQLEKLRGFGIEASLNEVITSGYACSLYLQEKFPGGRIHILGPASLETELREAGFSIVFENADAVVVARDGEFNMQKLDSAFQNMLDPNCEFVACAANPIHPGESGKLHPGGGAMVAALSACSGRTPDIIIGKPSTPMMELALKNFGLLARECAVIGDILDMDILCAERAGMESIYVLSGIGKREDIARLGITPTHVRESVANLLDVQC